jgi:hypothetical protein
MEATQKTYIQTFFIKFGKEEFLQNLRDEGEIYCNTVDYFRSIEDKELRGDPLELAVNIVQGVNLELKFEGNLIGVAPTVQLREFNSKVNGNLFCFYNYDASTDWNGEQANFKINIDSKNFRFGDSALIILEPREFFTRIKNTLDLEEIPFHLNHIDYYDHKSFQGKLTPFSKSEIFSYQNEVRLFLPGDGSKVKQFKIGNISDISVLMKTSDLAKLQGSFK